MQVFRHWSKAFLSAQSALKLMKKPDILPSAELAVTFIPETSVGSLFLLDSWILGTGRCWG